MSQPKQFSLNEAMSVGINGPTAVLSWLQAANGAPQGQANAQATLQPQPMDVLCGKSKRCVDHGGSRRFRTVIECYREKYQHALTKWDKTSVTRTIYDNLTQTGSRFLKYNESTKIWEEVSPMAARDKIGHALRFANRVTRRKRGASCIGGKPSPAVLVEAASGTGATPLPPPPQVMGSAIPAVAPSQPAIKQLPPLGSMSTLQIVPAAPQLLLAQQQTTPTPFPALPNSAQVEPAAPSSAVQGGQSHTLLIQSFLPLNRSQGWYQNKESDNLKSPSKSVAITSLDDSLSLLEGILPLNQSADGSQPTAAEVSFDMDFDAEILSVLF